MKIYFTAPLYQKSKHAHFYREIVGSLRKLSHAVITDIFDYEAEKVLGESEEYASKYLTIWNGYLRECDIAIAEISFPGTVNIGFEVASILDRGKPVIALYRKGTDPVFITKDFSSRMIKIEYTLNDIEDVLRWALEEAQQMLNRRFTFFVSPDIDNHLTKISRQYCLSRSDYIRNLILQDMKISSGKKK